MEEKIYIFDNTKLSKTKTTTYTFKELLLLNPTLLEEIFNSKSLSLSSTSSYFM